MRPLLHERLRGFHDLACRGTVMVDVTSHGVTSRYVMNHCVMNHCVTSRRADPLPES